MRGYESANDARFFDLSKAHEGWAFSVALLPDDRDVRDVSDAFFGIFSTRAN